MIELVQITKTYRMGEHAVHALQEVSIRIEDGDFVAIMGPSGSGKSTLTQIVGLLDVPTSGNYRLNDREVSQLSEDELAQLRREEVGFIFQSFNLLPRMTALENVTLPLLYTRKLGEAPFAEELLKRVGLSSRIQHKPNELSGGQQQRVAIARSLVNRPRLILADEPTGNLDSQSQTEILDTLAELNNEGITVVIVTHEEEVSKRAHRVIRMRDGRVQSDERHRPLPKSRRRDALSPPEKRTVWRRRWEEITEHFGQGVRTLATNRVRTALSMLGILIGVAAVVAMLALGRGAQSAIESQLASLGSNLLVLRPGAVRVGGVAQDAGATTRLTYEDAQMIRQQVPLLRAVGPTVNGRGQATFSNRNWSTQILGATENYPQMRAAQPEIGRFFTEDENRKRTRVAVLGATVVRELFGDQSPIGETIKIKKIAFQVIGILPEKGNNGWRDQDDLIVIPILTAMHRLLGKDYVDSIDLEVKDAESIPAAQEGVLQLMVARKRLPPSMSEDAFQVRNMADVQSALSESSRTMSLLLAAIAAISLLVGGIGIMNIMLVSVTERTREIGLRKAVGAKRRDILQQFLAEAVVVSVAGGVAGIVLGWLITVVLTSVTGWVTTISVFSVLLAFFFSALIGVLFGIYPARRASLLPPIEALRYE